MTVDAASGSNPYAQLIANSDLATQTNAAKNANKTDTSASAAVAKTKTDKDMFLKLLVAQLKYQDPSKPADTTAFMAQTAQFSALETMQEVATSSGSMVAAQNKLQASALIGQTVTYTGEDGTTTTAPATATPASSSSGTPGATGTTPATQAPAATGTDQNSGTTGTTGSTDSSSTPSA
jgi:flagellar basal-body rod modification protein FlgD